MIRLSAMWVTEVVVFTCLVAAAGTDIRHRIIPNALVLAVAIAALALQLEADLGHVWLGLTICAATLAGLGVLASYSLVGWGDVKMIAAVTLLAPPAEVLVLLVAIALAGGVLACTYLVARHVLGSPVPAGVSNAAPPQNGAIGVLQRERDRILTREPMPYALAVLGGVAYYTATKAMQCWPVTYCL